MEAPFLAGEADGMPTRIHTESVASLHILPTPGMLLCSEDLNEQHGAKNCKKPDSDSSLS